MTAKEERQKILELLSELNQKISDIESKLKLGSVSMKQMSKDLIEIKKNLPSTTLVDLVEEVKPEKPAPRERRQRNQRKNLFNPDEYRNIQHPEGYEEIDDTVTAERKTRRSPHSKKSVICVDCRKEYMVAPILAKERYHCDSCMSGVISR